MRLLIPFLLAMAIAPPAGLAASGAQDIQTEVTAVLTDTVAAREKAFPPARAGQHPTRPWTEDMIGPGFMEPQLQELVFLAADHTDPRGSLYREAVESALSSPDSRLRGLAAMVLGAIRDERSILRLGPLVDDDAPSAPAVAQVTLASGGTRWSPKYGTVDQAARGALRGLTNTVFHHRADFEAWWRVNRNRPEEKLWYWAARWSDRRYRPTQAVTHWQEADARYPWPPPGPPASWEAVSGDREADLEALARLPGDTGLKILLLVHVPYALQEEAQASVGDPVTPLPARVLAVDQPWTPGAPSTANVAAYVTRYHLQARLMELLRGRRLYPEVTPRQGRAEGAMLPDKHLGPEDGWSSLLDWRPESRGFQYEPSELAQTPAAGQQELVIEIARVGEWVFMPQDELAIAEVERTRTDQRTRVVLALLRSRIAPARGHEILRDELQAHPDWTALARELILRYGVVDAEALRLACTGNRSAQDAVADAIHYVAESRPASPQALAAIIGTLQPPTPEDLGSAQVLAALALASDQAAKKPLISMEEIDSLDPYRWAPGAVEDRPARGARLARAFATIKARLLAALQAL